MKSIATILAAVIYFVVITGCGNSAKRYEERELVIAKKQTVEVEEFDLYITNNGCGSRWRTESDPPAEIPYCNIEIRYKDSTVYIDGFKPLYIDDIEIAIDRMNPWNRVEDSIPPGGCRLWIKKVVQR